MITIYVTQPIVDARIVPDTVLSDDLISNQVSVGASPGEYVPGTFTIHTTEEVSGLLPICSNLTGPGVIPAANVDIRYVKCWLQAPNSIDVYSPRTRPHPAGVYIYDKRKDMTPELLLRDDTLVKVETDENYVKMTDGSYRWESQFKNVTGAVLPTDEEFPVKDADTLQPVGIPANYNKQIWVTIKVPENAQPGTYGGIIDLSTPGGSIGQVGIALQVYPISLFGAVPEPSILYISRDEWTDKGHIGTWRNSEQLRAEMVNMKEHGVINPTVGQPWVHRDNARWVNKFRNYLSIRLEVGLAMNPLYYQYTILKNEYQDPDELRLEIRAIRDICAEYGVHNLYIYCADEQQVSAEERKQIEIAHEEGVKVFVSGSYGTLAPAFDILDAVNTSGKHWGVNHDPDRDIALEVHSYGHKIFSYSNPQGGIEKPETYRRNYGLLLWQRDYNGGMAYAYHCQLAFTWNDFDHSLSDPPPADPPYGYKDHDMVYPTINGVIDTLQWEGFREGITDVRYLTTLLGTIEAAKARGVNTTEAESYLANLKITDLSATDLDQVRQDTIGLILRLQLQPIAATLENAMIAVVVIAVMSAIIRREL